MVHFFIDAGEMTTIIFDIDCYDATQFTKDYGTLLQERKNYGWPLDYTDMVNLIERLNRQYFCINSSCGISGFILAEEMQISTEGRDK